LPLLAKEAWQPNLATAHLEKVTVTQYDTLRMYLKTRFQPLFGLVAR